jgi:hypothetical protein
MDIINYIKNNDFYNFKKIIDEDKSIINFNDNCLIQHCCEQNRYIFVKYLQAKFLKYLIKTGVKKFE